MAITLVTTPDPSAPIVAADYGYQNGLIAANEVPKLSVLDNWELVASEPVIKSGTYLRHASSTYLTSGDETISGSPSAGYNYIEITLSGSTLTAAWVTATTGYTFNQAHGGIYAGAGTQLLPDLCFLDGADYIRGRSFGMGFSTIYLANGNLFFSGAMNTNGGDVTTGAGSFISDDFDTSTASYTPSNYITDSIAYSNTGVVGLTFDGTNLIAIDDTANTVIVHTGISASITTTFATPGTVPDAVTCDGTNLISSDGFTDLIYIHSGITSSISSSFATGVASLASMTYDGTNLISHGGGNIRVHSGVTSTISTSWAAPTGQLAFDGTNIILYTATGLKYVYDGITSAIILIESTNETNIVGSTNVNGRIYTQTTAGYKKRGKDIYLL